MAVIGRATFRNGRLAQRQVHRHRRVIRDAVLNGLVELAHGPWEMRCEEVALVLETRMFNEGFDEEPIEFESTHQTAVVFRSPAGTTGLSSYARKQRLHLPAVARGRAPVFQMSGHRPPSNVQQV
jgi:hypothetical protein